MLVLVLVLALALALVVMLALVATSGLQLKLKPTAHAGSGRQPLGAPGPPKLLLDQWCKPRNLPVARLWQRAQPAS